MAATATKTTIQTSLFVRSHLAKPRGRGNWGFIPAGTSLDDAIKAGTITWVCDATLTEARRELPAGTWNVCP